MRSEPSTEVDMAVAEIQRQWPVRPEVALVLGTGLGLLADQFRAEVTIPFERIPGFRTTTALGHRGQVVCGHMCDLPLILFNGRSHFYEGCSCEEITFPIRVLHGCGASSLIVSNASGGLNPRYATGDVMVIADHIDLMGRCSSDPGESVLGRPARGEASPYDPALNEQALSIARRSNFVAHQGVYVAVPGPKYETGDENRVLRKIGGEVEGKWTVPEAIAAKRLGMRVHGLSFVTNVATPDAPETVDAAQVVDAAANGAPRLLQVVAGVLDQLKPP